MKKVLLLLAVLTFTTTNFSAFAVENAANANCINLNDSQHEVAVLAPADADASKKKKDVVDPVINVE